MTDALKRVALHVPLDEAETVGIEIVKEFKPDWDLEKLIVKRLTAGITNVIIMFSLSDNSDDPLLIRLYGRNTELIIDRSKEIRNHLSLHSSGLAPPIFGVFKNGYAYGFCEGKPCTPPDVWHPEVFPLIAKRLAEIHRIPHPEAATPAQPHSIFNIIEKWLTKIPETYTVASKNTYFRANISLEEIKADVAYVKSRVGVLHAPIVFCHNDLLCQNIIYHEGKSTVSFIDYEYGCFGERGFDIGNHFCEYAGVDVVKYEDYPDKPHQLSWLRVYLAALNDKTEEEITDEELERLYAEVNAYALVAHLHWGVWALVQAENSLIEFDYLPYAKMRFDEFNARKASFLALLDGM